MGGPDACKEKILARLGRATGGPRVPEPIPMETRLPVAFVTRTDSY